MFIGITTLVIFIWAYGGCVYREKLYLKGIQSRAETYNRFVEAMNAEFGEQKVSQAARAAGVPVSMGNAVNKDRWAVRAGW